MATSPPLESPLLSVSEDLCPPIPQKFPSTLSLTFSNALCPPLLLHEDLKEGCGGQTWPAGMHLTRFLLVRKDELRGKNIVEIGAGGGLVGLALSLGLAQSSPSPNAVLSPVIITDLPILTPLQSFNINLNSLSSSQVLSVPLPWGEPLASTSLPKSHYQPDVLLAADCVYFEPAFPLLLQTMHEMIGPKTVCWFCVKRRRRADKSFILEMKKAKWGWIVKELRANEVMTGDESEKGVVLYEVRRREERK